MKNLKNIALSLIADENASDDAFYTVADDVEAFAAEVAEREAYEASEAAAREAYEARSRFLSSLVKAWMEGDSMAGAVLDDVLKEEYGVRPHYSLDEAIALFLRG